MILLSQHLVLHAAIILFAALLFGGPYARAIKRNAEFQVINSWRVAHQSLTIGALLLFCMAYALPLLIIPIALKIAIAIFFTLSGYAFTISTPLAAITKDRGLATGATGIARLVYIGNMVGAVSSLIASGLLVIGALFSILSSQGWL